jgi:NAD(P)-dependent dehydrogenase (short-subunit alcohol dehydrogenase family)
MGQETGSLKDKVAIVTGASTPKGIGNAIAQRFARAGASVFLVAEGTTAQLQATQKACQGFAGAGRIEYGVFDLSRPGAAEQMVAKADELFGRVDVLVNNAGIRAPYDYGDYTRDHFDRVVAVNLASPFFAGQSVIPIMRRQGGGRIINIASQLGKVTFAKRALYGLTKAALIHLTKSMAYELGVHGIVVNSISPGPVKTQPILDRMEADPAEAERRLKNYVPLGRFGEPWEIADLALYLATTEATFLQGEDICIDGGYTVH